MPLVIFLEIRFWHTDPSTGERNTALILLSLIKSKIAVNQIPQLSPGNLSPIDPTLWENKTTIMFTHFKVCTSQLQNIVEKWLKV